MQGARYWRLKVKQKIKKKNLKNPDREKHKKKKKKKEVDQTVQNPVRCVRSFEYYPKNQK